MFLSLDLVMIALQSSLYMKCALFARMYLFYIGACSFKIHIKRFSNSSQDMFREPNVLRHHYQNICNYGSK